MTDTVEVLLNARHAAERVLRVWGGAEVGTVGWAKAAVKVMVREYVSSGDLVEARRCLRDINMPHFHHELVKRALCLAVESDEAVEPVFTLLKVGLTVPGRFPDCSLCVLGSFIFLEGSLNVPCACWGVQCSRNVP